MYRFSRIEQFVNMLRDRWLILILVLHSVTYLYGLYSDEKSRFGEDYGSFHDIPRNIECNIVAVASVCSDFWPEVRNDADTNIFMHS